MIFLLADSALEIVPPRLWNCRDVKAYAKK
jgi:rRNA pseudouridine-1189 N-methylase Emg1 (Nep1/Mra1 family)